MSYPKPAKGLEFMLMALGLRLRVCYFGFRVYGFARSSRRASRPTRSPRAARKPLVIQLVAHPSRRSFGGAPDQCPGAMVGPN